MPLKISSAKWQPFCLSLNELTIMPYILLIGNVTLASITGTTLPVPYHLAIATSHFSFTFGYPIFRWVAMTLTGGKDLQDSKNRNECQLTWPLLKHNLNCILTHWCRVTHICVSKLTSIGSDNGLAPGRRQAIIWTNAGILLIGHLGTNFSEILI